MAKRQNFIVGSTNVVTESLTDAQLDAAFDRYEILTADKLDGVFKAVSDYSNDSSNEIANAIQSITGSQPSGSSQTELANALQQMRNEIETTSLTFKGYVATSAPSSSTYTLVEGNIWINSATMPTSFPIAASSIKEWNGSSWVNYGSTYTPADFDFFRNINDNEGYYWFGGVWTVMSTDMSTTYFTLNQSTGKWEIKSSVNLPGSPTTTTPDAADQSTKIATTQFAYNFGQRYISNCITQIPQDIKLELNNGTLTLKAGSKVYVPNGAGVFDVYTVASDISRTFSVSNATVLIFLDTGNLLMPANSVADCTSGTTAPSGSGIFYDTNANTIRAYSSGTPSTSKVSFPFAQLSFDSGGNCTIDQVFNGFGYIGSTVFALPGTTQLIPNGFNADGTLNNTKLTANTIKTRTLTATVSNAVLAARFNTGTPFGIGTDVKYDESRNINTSSGVDWNYGFVGTISTSSGSITSFTTKQPFHAVDYFDFDTADQQNVKLTGDQTIAGTKTFSSAISGSITGNAGTVTNGVYTTGPQTIGGTKTFSSSPLVPNVGTMNDNSQKAASTKFVLDILKTIYPVGSVYIGTQNSCPMSSLFGTWTLVSSGKALWTGTGSNGNTTIAAGLPNITGTVTGIGDVTVSGAFERGPRVAGNGGGDGNIFADTFDASRSSSIYGASTTVQPPAYVVNVWRRTA